LSIEAATPPGDQQLKRSVGVLSLFATAYRRGLERPDHLPRFTHEGRPRARRS
jgi:hypothetical protein